MDTQPASGVGGPNRDHHDHARLRHARERELGFPVGRFIQTPPMLFTRDSHNVFLGDMYRGHSAFLVCAGPSLNMIDHAELNRRGVLTMAVNNAAAVVRPNLWCSVDDPGNFCDAIWYDAGIMKFVPLCHMEKHFIERADNGDLVKSIHKVGDMPAVFGFRRNEAFNAEQWLYEDTINWGNHSNRKDALGNKGSRSVMYAALRLLFFLGVRRVFLLGCDFRMEVGKSNYAFDQDRTKDSVRGNNSTYRIFNDRMHQLQPHFEQAGFRIFNCTQDSGLTAFPYVSFDNAIELATSVIPERIITTGMYDRQARERQRKKNRQTEDSGASKSPEVKAEPRKPADRTRPVPSREAVLRDLTLLLAVDEKHIPNLKAVWPTWTRFRPEFREIPLVVSYDASRSAEDLGITDIIDNPNLKLIPWSMEQAESQRELMLTSFVKSAASEVETKWYLKLDTDVIASSTGAWLEPEWFAEEDDRLPAFIASPWGYTKPADAISQLDEWGDAIGDLSQFPRLDIPFDPRKERVHHPRIASWCFFGNTEWTRDVASYVNGRLPVPSHDTYLFYCAARRHDLYRRVKMAGRGWELVSSLRRLQRRCRDILGEEAAC